MADASQDGHPRTIRSFVLRSGRITPAQERAFENLWPRFGIEFSPSVLNLDDVFGRTVERVLEIGFGDGETLVQQAADDAGRDYLGIEVHRPGVGHCLLRASQENVRNLRLIVHDALDVLKHQLAPGSITRINIYFPDPWPKKKHHKRRLLQTEFLALAAKRLTPHGTLHIATDWRNYAEHIDEIVAASAAVAVVERREHGGDAPLDRPVTKFERRGLKQGHKIVDWRLERR